MTNPRSVIFHIDPVPEPRMVRSDAWNQRPVVIRYRQFRDEIGYKIKEFNLEEAIKNASTLCVEFTIKMPGSWSNAKKDRMRNCFHQQKPDIDNLVKSLMDSLFRDIGSDETIACITASKKWGDEGKIDLTI